MQSRPEDLRSKERGSLWFAAGLLLISALALPLLSLRQPSPDTEVALIFAPGTSQDAAMAGVAMANGRFVRPGAWPNVLIAVFPNDLAWRDLWSIGALVAIDPLAVGSCLISNGAAS